MSRTNLSSEMAEKLAAANVTAFFLVEFGFDAERVYLADLPFDVEWEGQTYSGAQHIGRIEPFTETDSEARGLQLTLSAVTQASIAAALTEEVQGREVLLRLVIVDGTTLRTDPCVWRGVMDVMGIEDDGQHPVIRVTAEHEFIAWQQPSGALFSDPEQQEEHPGDKFFEFAAQIADATIAWPSAAFFKK